MKKIISFVNENDTFTILNYGGKFVILQINMHEGMRYMPIILLKYRILTVSERSG